MTGKDWIRLGLASILLLFLLVLGAFYALKPGKAPKPPAAAMPASTTPSAAMPPTAKDKPAPNDPKALAVLAIMLPKPTSVIELCDGKDPLETALAPLGPGIDGLIRMVARPQLPDGVSAEEIEGIVGLLCDNRYAAWEYGNKLMVANNSWESSAWRMDREVEDTPQGLNRPVLCSIDQDGHRQPRRLGAKRDVPEPEPAWWPQVMRTRQAYDAMTLALRRLQVADWQAVPRPTGIQDPCELFFATGDPRPRIPSQQEICSQLNSELSKQGNLNLELPPLSWQISPHLPGLYARCLEGKTPLPPANVLGAHLMDLSRIQNVSSSISSFQSPRSMQMALLHYWLAGHLNACIHYWPQPPESQQVLADLAQEMEQFLAKPPATADDWLIQGTLDRILVECQTSPWESPTGIREKPPLFAKPPKATPWSWGRVYEESLEGIKPWLLELAALRRQPPQGKIESCNFLFVNPLLPSADRPWRPGNQARMEPLLQRTEPLPVPKGLEAKVPGQPQADASEPRPVPAPPGFDPQVPWVDGLPNMKRWLEMALIEEIQHQLIYPSAEPTIESLSRILVNHYQRLTDTLPEEQRRKQALAKKIDNLRHGGYANRLPAPLLELWLSDSPPPSQGGDAKSPLGASPAPEQIFKEAKALFVPPRPGLDAERQRAAVLLQGKTLAGPLSDSQATDFVALISTTDIPNPQFQTIRLEAIACMERSVDRWAREPQPAAPATQEKFRQLVLQLQAFLTVQSQLDVAARRELRTFVEPGDPGLQAADSQEAAWKLRQRLAAALEHWRTDAGWTAMKKPRCLMQAQTLDNFQPPSFRTPPRPSPYSILNPAMLGNTMARMKPEVWRSPFYYDELLAGWGQDPLASWRSLDSYENQSVLQGKFWGLHHVLPDQAWVQGFEQSLTSQRTEALGRQADEAYRRQTMVPSLAYVIAGQVSGTELSPGCTPEGLQRLLELVRQQWEQTLAVKKRMQDPKNPMMGNPAMRGPLPGETGGFSGAQAVAILQRIPWRAMPMPEWLRQAEPFSLLDDDGQRLVEAFRKPPPPADPAPRQEEQRPPLAINRQALSDFIEQLILEVDLNHNGVPDPQEAGAVLQKKENQGRYPYYLVFEALPLRLMQYKHSRGFGLSKEERLAIRNPRIDNQEAIRQPMAAYDADKDGKLNRREQIQSDPQRRGVFNTKEKWETLFWLDSGSKAVPDAVFRQADRDGNGWLDAGEAKVLDNLSLPPFDANGNGLIDATERRLRTRQAWCEDALFILCPEADAGHDGEFSAEETARATALLTPLYDLDRNARLDPCEWDMIVRDSRRFLAATLAQKDPAANDDAMPGKRASLAAGGRQEELAILEQRQAEIEAWLFNVWRRQLNPAWNSERRLAAWKTHIAPYDANGNGKLDGLELFRFWDGGIELGGQDPWTDPPAWIALSSFAYDNKISIDSLLYWPLLFSLVDTDGDGFCSRPELQALQERNERLGPTETARQLAIVLYPGIVANLARIRPEERATLDAEIGKAYDLNHDGLFSRQELANLQQDFFAKLEYPGLWRPGLDRLADIDRDGQISAAETETIQALIHFTYDTNDNGIFDLDELPAMLRALKSLRPPPVMMRFQPGPMAPNAKNDRRYDLDGDGKLNSEERQRMETEQRQGILAPTME